MLTLVADGLHVGLIQLDSRYVGEIIVLGNFLLPKVWL
jgi:hypothetical protein